MRGVIGDMRRGGGVMPGWGMHPVIIVVKYKEDLKMKTIVVEEGGDRRW